MNGRFRAIVLIALLVEAGVSGLQAQPRREVLQAPATKATPEGRIDPTTGRWQARYRVRTPVAWQGSADATARAYLRMEAVRFGWRQPDRTLAVDRVRTTPYAMHVRFRQTLAGLPVYGRYVQVNLNRQGRPTLVLSGYDPRLEAYAARFDPTPRLSATAALNEARRRLAQPEAPTTTPELVVWPAEPPRLAWHFVLWPQDRPDEWAVLVDARSGELLHVRSQAVQERPAKATRAKATAAWTPTAPLPVGLVAGEGMVFDPDPLATAGVPYGGAYADNDDADTPELNAERLVVTLPDITQGGDGLYRLEGPYVRITGDIPGIADTPYDPPAEATPDAFRYTRADDHFEAVMAYYQIDRSQRYVQQLDLGTAVLATPIRVNPHGFGQQDNSQFYPSQNAIVFGDGGVDDAEDATVIWHEYMHALLEDAAPGLLGDNEGRALHEGWADYWAASYVRGLVEAGLVRRTDWDFVFRWDSGDGTIWEGRHIAFTGRYPEDTNCDREDTPRQSCNIYEDGLLWTTVLMEIQNVLGKAVTDRLAMAAALYLSPPATFRDAAQALLQADMDYYDGAHLAVLIDRLGARGLVDPDAIRLVVRHDPNQDVRIETDHLMLQVVAVARGDSVVRVQAFYEQAGQFVPTALFQPVNDTLFEGQIPWDGVPGRFRYYLEAETAGGWVLRQPLQAPVQTYEVDVGRVATADVLQVARAGSGWRQGGAAWTVDGRLEGYTTLVLLPVSLATNADRLRLHLTHRFNFGMTCEGYLESSADGGRTWEVLLPESGGTPKRPFGAASPPEGMQHTFDLSEAAGSQQWLRFTFGCTAADPSAFWTIEKLELEQATRDPALRTRHATQLLAPFPNPFRRQASIPFTLDAVRHVRLVVYDLLGREVARLVDATLSAGSHVAMFRPEGLAAGMYLIRLEADGKVQTRSVLFLSERP
ncbi:T9SS type A sorting domain-containing protein [Rhodothermus marinus]|uniref:T9SS type A sorting domain-containing protein n=1 Tax=Rhodothermus marinus TaxID=29549 RepID=UPI0012BA513C|nr:T9SS type A sorting domain-containing protein [Rhodothermus marinus]BBM71019.1 hypothetical protein RmaAA213_28650 [Rhodothermus marinus]